MAGQFPGRNWEANMERRLAQSVARSRDLFGSRGSTALGPRSAGGPSDGIPWWRGLASATDGVFAMMSDGRITLWNPAAERITGYTAGEVLGRRCWDVFAGREASGERFCSSSCPSPTLIKSGGPIESFDLQISSKGGRLIWLNMSTVVLPIADAQ